MIQLGKMQTLTVCRIKDFGVYLGEEGDDTHTVLLPGKQVPKGTVIGDRIEVFLYKDSEDRLIATTMVPLIQVGQTAVLKVKDVAKIGAFLDMGLEKDLFLPFREQNHKVSVGESCLVALYIDKSERLAATMKIYSYMSADSPYQKDDHVSGVVYEINPDLGVFVAVDNQYYGMIPRQEMYEPYHMGEIVQARVIKVREDGKLDLSPREKAYLQMDADAALVMKGIEEAGGILPFTDKADPALIQKKFQMSKNAFKRAVGRLLKEKKIRITGATIEKIDQIS